MSRRPLQGGTDDIIITNTLRGSRLKAHDNHNILVRCVSDSRNIRTGGQRDLCDRIDEQHVGIAIRLLIITSVGCAFAPTRNESVTLFMAFRLLAATRLQDVV